MVISISPQKAGSLLRQMGTNATKMKRGFNGNFAEHMLFNTGAKIKWSDYDGWYIRTYGCNINHLNIS